jgi:hypothetical protein
LVKSHRVYDYPESPNKSDYILSRIVYIQQGSLVYLQDYNQDDGWNKLFVIIEKYPSGKIRINPHSAIGN